MSTAAGERNEADRVLIFDTTLRDGEQSPGISLNKQEKLEIAHQLARLGVDVIEAGFPITSPGDFESVQAIAREVEGPVICGLARTSKQDIEAAWNAVRDSERPRIHTFISTSDIHIEHQLQSTREDVKGQARAAVAQAKDCTDMVEFSPMDATRAELEFTAEVIQIAIDEGATTINIADTVGYTMPQEFTAYLEGLYELVPALRDVVLSVHCHDDLGLAVANSFAGVLAGARQVECAINGIGERAGNASLEEIVMLLRTRHASSTRRSTRRRSLARAGWSRGSRAIRCSRTRRSSGETPSRTSRASIRMACSRSAPPTRSWMPRRSGCRRTRSCLASTRAATRCAKRSRRWASSWTGRR
jgi:2-isopropylmalate synthase